MRRVTPPNLSKRTKRDAERAQKQLARVSLAIRRLGRKARRRSTTTGEETRVSQEETVGVQIAGAYMI
jgi:hypothetical protein